jgi:hypothetical protein
MSSTTTGASWRVRIDRRISILSFSWVEIISIQASGSSRGG